MDWPNSNPLTGLNYSEESRKIWEKMKLKKFAEPEVAKEFIDTVRKNDITIVLAGTGVGKTILAPVHLLRAYKFKIKIGMSQPKQLLTEEASKFIAKGILDSPPGKYVSYQYRFNKNVSETTLLTLMTDALLLLKLVKDPEYYDIVMIDEVHERNVNMDLILFLINHYYANIDFWNDSKNIKKYEENKEKYPKNIFRPKRLKNPIKFILLSATLDPTTLIRYFTKTSSVKVGVFEVEGRTYPITNYFFGEDIMKNISDSEKNYIIRNYLDYTKTVVDKILSIRSPYKDGDVLVFLPTKQNIEEMVAYIGEKYGKKVYAGALFSGIDPKRKELAIDKDLYKEKGLGKRKIVFSTPVAEAGLTVEGIKYVIESGVSNEMSIDQYTGFRTLKVSPINISSAIQRCGRGGRLGPGTCFHLYPEEYYSEKFGRVGTPQIYKENVKDLIMKVMKMTSNVNIATEILSSKMLDNIDRDIVEKNTTYLYKNHVINTADGTFTDAGKFLSMIDLDIDLAILIMKSFMFKIPKLMVIIAGMMSVSRTPRDFFKFKVLGIKNGVPIKDPRRVYGKYRNRYGDPVTFLNIFRFFYSNFHRRAKNYPKDVYKKKLDIFCAKNELDVTKFKDIMKIVKNVEKKINDAKKEIKGGIQIESFPKDLDKLSEEDRIIRCFIETYRGNTLIYDPIKKMFSNSSDKAIDKLSPFLEKVYHDKKLGKRKTVSTGYAELLLIGENYKTACDFPIYSIAEF